MVLFLSLISFSIWLPLGLKVFVKSKKQGNEKEQGEYHNGELFV